METGPYSNGRVDGEISKDFVPMRADVSLVSDLAEKCRVIWTPTIVFLDMTGHEHHRVVGFVPTDDLIAHIYLARGKIAFDSGQYDEALVRFKFVMERHPKYDLGPEARYWYAVTRYKRTGSMDILRDGWKVLRTKFPESPWARKTIFLDK